MTAAVEKPDSAGSPQSTDRLESWLKVTRIATAALALAPGIPLLVSIIFVFASLLSVVDALILVMMGLSCIAMPLLPFASIAGIVFSVRAKRRTEGKYPVTVYILGGVLWVVWAVVLLNWAIQTVG